MYFENSANEDEFALNLVRPLGLEYALSLVPVERGEAQINEASKIILSEFETHDAPLELSGLSGKEAVVAVFSPLTLDFEPGLNSGVFDDGYVYRYAAEFGSGLEVIEVIDPTEEVPFEDGAGGKEGEEAELHGQESTDAGLALSVLDFDEDSVTFSWNRVTDPAVAAYELYYNPQGADVPDLISIPQPFTTFTRVTDLAEGEPYEFQILAVDAEGSVLGNASVTIVVTPRAWLFNDLSYQNSNFESIEALVDLGILSGYPDGSFQPLGVINRAELLKILIEGRGLDPDPVTYSNCFPDVSSEWFARYVCYAFEQGWVQGYPSGLFDPGRTVNKVEALKILFNVYEAGLVEGAAVLSLPYPDVDRFAWYAVYLDEASRLGLLSESPSENFNPDRGRNRGEMSEILHRYLVVEG